MQPITLLKDKRIVLAVTGSIAVYKAVDLASKLTQAGAQVDVIMTASAKQFVAPITFQSVTGRPVYDDLWQSDSSGSLPTHIAHVGLGEGADLMVIAPLTANTMARLAHGFADDLLTVTALAVRCPLVIAPAMDGGMYEHPATQENLRILTERNAYLIEPEEGRFASGLTGCGRLPETSTLLGHIRQRLGQEYGALAGKKVVVTAGGTREAIDPVRYVTNRSSGKQGFAIAQAAVDAGANVMLISTIDTQPVPVGASLINVESAGAMRDAVLANLDNAAALVMAAAVADFKPTTVADQKIKKSKNSSEGLTIQLIRTPDILLSVKDYRAEHGFPLVTVGFAAESQNLLENAQGKLERKALDFILANDITATDAGFQVDTNRVILLDAVQGRTDLELMSKAHLSELIVQRIATRL